MKKIINTLIVAACLLPAAGVPRLAHANNPPTVSLTSSPPSGTTLSAYGLANITLNATATDSDGIRKVEFYKGTQYLGADISAPYSFSYPYSLPAGTHVFTAKAYDTWNASAVSGSVSFTVIENWTPTVALTSPSNGSTYTAPATITLSAAANDMDGIAKVQFYRGTTLLGTDYTSPYSLTLSNIPAGTYGYSAKAYDTRNLSAVTPTATVTVVAPNVPPTVSLTSPANNSSFTAPASITLAATASDSNGISKVEFYNGTTLLGTDTTSPYGITLSGVAAGTYAYKAKAYDTLNASTLSAVVNVTVAPANVPPSVSLTAPAGGTTYTAPASISLSANAADSDGSIASVEFYNGAILIGAGTLTSGSYTLDWSNVGAGSYSLTAKATDNQGAVTVSAPVTITVNPPNVPPSVSITAPTDGSSYTAPASITLSATAADPDGSIASVKFYNGANLIGAGTLTSGSYTLDWSNVGAGSYSLTAKATDNHGAVTVSAPVAISVNAPNVPPNVSIAAPTAGSTYIAPASISLSSNAADSDGSIASVEFYNGANLIGAGTLTSGSYTLDWSNVGAGSYSLTAKATDNQGAVTVSAPVTITVNSPNVPPSVSITAPTDGSSYTAPASITLSATAADPDGSIASVEFYDGATLIASVTTPPYSHTWNDVQSGSHVITAKATDNQGASTSSTPVTVGMFAPPAGNVYYIHADHLNTPRVITDASNQVVWRWDSDPFGTDKANEDPDGDGAKFSYNLRFPGQYYDRETNLHYNYFRDYDPTTGRYVQSDPIGLEGGANLYSYVLGDPIGYTDPLGLSPYNDPMNQIANRAAGLPPNANLPPPIKGTVTANLQFGNVGPIPVGVSYQCTIDNDGMRPSYLGAGIVIGRSLRYGATATNKNGDPSGYGVRTSISVPVVKGGGISASTVATSTGSATSVGIQTVGAGASGSVTYGYGFQ